MSDPIEIRLIGTRDQIAAATDQIAASYTISRDSGLKSSRKPPGLKLRYLTVNARAAGQGETVASGIPIPASVLRMHPNVPADAWERLSAHRYRAPHTGHPDRYVWCVVTAFDETVGQAARHDDQEHQAEVFAGLFETAASLASHRVSCQDGTPVVRPDDEANILVVDRCWWCGKYPAEHTGAEVGAEVGPEDGDAR